MESEKNCVFLNETLILCVKTNTDLKMQRLYFFFTNILISVQ